MPRTILPGLVIVVAAAPLAAQGSPIGTWKVTYPAGTRVENGEQSAIMGTGTLRIEGRGDSLLGELVPDPVPDLPARKTTRMTGPLGSGPVALVARLTAVVNVNGAARPVNLTSTWRLEVKADSLVGTLSHDVEDAEVMAQDPGPVRGIRLQP